MGISIWQLLIVLVIVLLLFGTKKLKNLGSDLGGAVKGFKSAMKDGASADEAKDDEPDQIERSESSPVDEGVTTKERDRA